MCPGRSARHGRKRFGAGVTEQSSTQDWPRRVIALRRVNADTNEILGNAPAPVTPSRGRLEALWRVGSLVVFAVLPVPPLATMLAVGLSDDSLSADFHHEIYPQAKQILEGHNPYPPPGFDPTVAPNFIWPPLVAYLAAPLTVLPLG